MELGEIATVVGGVVHGGPGAATVRVTAPACVDSRAAEPGGLFVAVVGERVDGHEYAATAGQAGAVAVLGSRPTALPTVVVDDVVAALGLLARHVRDRLGARVLALTGSQGKTGTKDYLAHVLSGVGPTVATQGNLNNELGVPLTVLRATEDTAHLVVEMGARGVGHIGYLCEIARPDVAAVLNVGSAHLGEFGSRERIAQAKGEIVEALAAAGTAVLNADDPLVAPMSARTPATVVTFGSASSRADVAHDGIGADDLARPRFTLREGGEQHVVRLAQVGRHQVANATAAAAMARAVGVPLAEVAASLATAASASRWRMEVTELPDGTVVLNDAYNANPDSMRAALETLAAVGAARGGRRIAVLGEMRELGEDEVAAHRQLGADAVAAGVDLLLTVGELAAHAVRAATATDDWPGEAIVTAGRDEAARRLGENVVAGDVVLVKASRGVALEHVVEALLEHRRGGNEEETIR